MKEMPNEKRVMIITGSSRGIGHFLANHYLKEGYQVFGCSRSNCPIKHDNYLHFKIDLSSESELISFIQFIRKQSRRLDVLINNAAINPAILTAAFLPYSTIENVFKINVFATMYMCREAVKLMSRNKSGRIINLGSMATRHEVIGEALYTSTKSSINAYTRVLAKEAYKLGITANVVAPSAIETELSVKINQEALSEVLARNAVTEFGQFIDVSNTIDFLLKPESLSITGQVIYLGGT